MRLVPSSGQAVRLGGLGPSLGAGVSLLAAGVTLSLFVASLFGVRVWSSPSDRGGTESLPLPAVPEGRGAAPEAEDRPGWGVGDRGAPALGAAGGRPGGAAAATRRVRRGAAPYGQDAAARQYARGQPAGREPARCERSGPGAGTGGDRHGPRQAPRIRPGAARATPAPTAPPAADAGPVEKTVAAVRRVAEPVATSLPVASRCSTRSRRPAGPSIRRSTPVTGSLQHKP